MNTNPNTPASIQDIIEDPEFDALVEFDYCGIFDIKHVDPTVKVSLRDSIKMLHG